MNLRHHTSKYDLLWGLRQRSDLCVDTMDDLYDIPTYRRKWGMVVAVLDDEPTDSDMDVGDTEDISGFAFYFLKYGYSSDDIRDNGNWKFLSFEGITVTYTSKMSGVHPGKLGQIAIDDDFLYICTATGGVGTPGEEGVSIWKRAPLRIY